MPFKVVIPARHASSRLPGKPLADIAGKPMVVRVAERAVQSGAMEVIVATDHEEVRAAVERHGFPALMTRVDHASGTDRIAEVVDRLGWGDDIVVVNVQGDEPLIAPSPMRRWPPPAIRFPASRSSSIRMSSRSYATFAVMRFISAARRFPGRAMPSPPTAQLCRTR